MTKIWSPTNLAWFINRILVTGAADVPNVNAMQDQIIVKPLSEFQGNTTTITLSSSTTATATTTYTNASKEVPIGPQPALIPTIGIKIYDEIGQSMIGNPLKPPDPVLMTKLASIGIGPGRKPSTQSNDTIKTALQTGITEGQKLIDAKVANARTVVNGWLLNAHMAVYGNDYLLCAAITQLGLGPNIAQESLHPATFTDIEG